ncbi:MAG: hypothetical protein CMK96_09995 [Pseudomonas sp.]|jgi:hypothetical protein|nr:hypothetical protein [Pseudomonas sp.]|tara:strand:+ start:150 stop:419 length:270 start_codon:yes stop_codon:yes gene_type:complete
MSVKIIEAEYHVEATHFWEIKYIDDWPRDSHGPLPLESAHDYYIKWGLLHVQWEKDGQRFEYEPTSEENGDGMDYKWPDAEYHDGERVE